MMEEKLRNLNQLINKSLGDIYIHDYMKEAISKRCQNRLLSFPKKIALPTVSFIIVLFITTLLWGSDVTNAMSQIVKYIPGINLLISNDNSNIYALSGTVTVKSLDASKYIKVLSCFTEDNIVKITMESNISVDWNKNGSISVIDKDGNNGELVETNIMGDGYEGSSDYKWIGTTNYKFDNSVNKFNICFGGFSVPIIMAKVNDVTNFEDYGNTIYENGIRIAAFTSYTDDGILQVKLAGISDDGRKITGFANGNVYLIDGNKNKHTPITLADEVSPDNTFFFNARLKDDLKIFIPYVILNDDKKVSLKLEIPQGESNSMVDLPLDFYNYGTKIVELKRYTQSIKFNFWKPDNLQQKALSHNITGLQIVVDKNFDYSLEDGLYDFSYTCDQNFLSLSDSVDGKNIYYSPTNNINNSKYNETRYKIINLPNFPADKTTLEISFTDPLYYQKGNWSITLKK